MKKFNLVNNILLDEAFKLLKIVPLPNLMKVLMFRVNLGIDARKSEQAVRGATVLPHGTGKTVRVAVFAQGDNAKAAQAAGADHIGFDDLAESY